MQRIIDYRSRALLSGCAYNPTGRKWAPINEVRLITKFLMVRFIWNAFLLVEVMADFLEEDLVVGRLIKSSWSRS